MIYDVWWFMRLELISGVHKIHWPTIWWVLEILRMGWARLSSNWLLSFNRKTQLLPRCFSDAKIWKVSPCVLDMRIAGSVLAFWKTRHQAEVNQTSLPCSFCDSLKVTCNPCRTWNGHGHPLVHVSHNARKKTESLLERFANQFAKIMKIMQAWVGTCQCRTPNLGHQHRQFFHLYTWAVTQDTKYFIGMISHFWWFLMVSSNVWGPQNQWFLSGFFLLKPSFLWHHHYKKSLTAADAEPTGLWTAGPPLQLSLGVQNRRSSLEYSKPKRDRKWWNPGSI